MDTPVPPVGDGLYPLYGAFARGINLLLALAVPVAAAAAQLPGKGEPPISEQTQLSGGVRPAGQADLTLRSADLSFAPDPATRRMMARAALVVAAKRDVAAITLDLDSNYKVESVTVDGKPVRITRPDGRIVVPHALARAAQAAIVIVYEGTPHVAVNAPWDDGMVWSQTPDGQPWIASTTEGYGCDLLWPCLDFPTGEPEVATLHIIAPKGLKAPSNGRLLKVETLPDGRTVWHWRARQPNTYAIAINIGPYEVIEGSYKSRYGNTIPLYYWHLPGEGTQAKKLFDEFTPTLDFFESVIGPYPFGDEKLGVVETPHKGMEHQTINAYGNGYAKAPEGFDWLFHHEFSHEWFANQLTAANWDDYWLHEGFGSYMQPLYGQWREGDARYAVMLEVQRNQITNRAPIVRDRVLTEEEVYEPSKGGAGTDIYYKGSWTLHTLRWLIGNRAFFDSIRRVVYGRRDPKPGNFTPRYGSTREFETIVQEESGRDLSWFFDTYLRDRALPELVTTRDGNLLRLAWRTERARVFPMPVELTVDGVTQRVQLPDGTATVTVPAGAHVVIDPAARILRRSVAVEEYQQWRQQQQKPR
ncbi:M1 family metallopeptidase [Sphingomonas sp. 8AM]|uniref:M1 family metallopeptidase n=1 Tax=Sphingomonas sp. 8AM TaxID=2653170 RepID=UPI0012F1B247|nr:M1 family metallopeptidase [Sphingomonas sp. 8AM]VXC51615.1 Peptidase M1 [Sphingomonas sp. 8AM]